MHIDCQRNYLASAVKAVAAAVPSRSPKPILQNVKLSVSGSAATLSGTDLEIGVRTTFSGVTVKQPGECLMPLSRLSSILAESSDETLSIKLNGDKVQIQGGRSKFSLPTEAVDEYPDVAEFDATAYHAVEVKALRELIKRTIFATDSDRGTRFALGGVLVEFELTGLRGVGTDGRRMAVCEVPAHATNGHAPTGQQTIVPAEALKTILTALSSATGEARVAITGSSLAVESCGTAVTARMLDGRFPKWQDVFPKAIDSQRVEIPVGPFKQAVKQAAIVTSDESRGVDFTFSEGEMRITARAAGESEVHLPIGYSGPEIKVALDHKFLADVFGVLDPASLVSVEIRNPESAVVLSTGGTEYRYVVMPLSRED